MKVVLQNLTKVFPNRDKKAGNDVVAVSDFTLEIPDGKLIGLLGPSRIVAMSFCEPRSCQ